MKKLLLIGAWALTSFTAKAQETTVAGTSDDDMRNIFIASWEIAFPANSNYMSGTSFSGLRFEYRNMISSNFSAGIAVTWNSFEDHVGTRTYTSDGGAAAVTTDMIRQVYTVPVTAIFHYYPSLDPKKVVRPYIGLGLGVCYAEQYSYFNVYELSDYNWGFAMRPELGSLFRLGYNLNAMLGVSYQYASNRNYDFDISNISQFAINIGLSCGF
jgi:outer membrane protein W